MVITVISNTSLNKSREKQTLLIMYARSLAQALRISRFFCCVSSSAYAAFITGSALNAWPLFFFSSDPVSNTGLEQENFSSFLAGLEKETVSCFLFHDVFLLKKKRIPSPTSVQLCHED